MSGARLSGTVKDSSGAVVTEAKVTLRNQATGIVQTSNTGTAGIYVFRALQPGTYDIRAERNGFQTIEAKGLTLMIGQDMGYDLVLKVGSVSEVVDVKAETPLVETEKGSVDTVITHEQLLNTPIDGRYFVDLIFISTPGIVGNTGTNLGEGFSVNGQRGFSNQFNIDGVSATNSLLQSTTGRINMDSIQEFQVLTHQFEAQYGNASGAVINVATRGGTNNFHGTGYGMFRNSAMDAGVPIDKLNAVRYDYPFTKPDTHRDELGTTFGGPIIKDKLFFFGSYEWETDKGAGSISAPIDTGKGVQTGPVTNLWSGRLDYTAGKNTFSARYNGQRSNGVWGPGGGNTLSTQYNEIYQPQSWQVSWNRAFSERTLGEFRAQFMDYQDSGQGVSTGYEEAHPSWTAGKFSNVPFNQPEYNGQAVYNLSMTRGRHDIKVGGSYQRIVSDGSNKNFGDGVYFFATDALYNAADPATYPYRYLQRFGPDGFHIPENVMDVFAQDKWSILPNLVLNYGIRYDFEDFFTAVGNIGTLNGQIAKNATKNFSPRVSLAYSPFGDKTVFKAGFGRFYSRIPLNEAALIIINTVNTRDAMTFDCWADAGCALPYPTAPTPSELAANPASSIDVLDDNLNYQYTDQYTVGVQHQFSPHWSINVDGVRILGNHLWTLVNRNSPDLVTGEQFNPAYHSISAQSSIGQSWYTALEFTLKHQAAKHTFTMTYTRSKTIDDIRGDPNGPGVTCSQAINAYGSDAIKCDRGLSNNDVPHRLTFDGLYRLPLGFNISGVMDVHPGYPWTRAAGYDVNGDFYTNDRVPGTIRNDQRGARYFWLQTRVAKEFKLRENWKASVFAEAFNLTNSTNWNNYVGNALSGLYGLPNGSSAGRRLQFGFRTEF
jgi:hypothetical protein